MPNCGQKIVGDGDDDASKKWLITPEAAGTTVVPAKKCLVVQAVKIALLHASGTRKQFNNGI